MTPARYTNQLVMHFLDAYKENPDWHIARLLLAARAQYARVNRLEKPLAELEKVGTVSADGEMDIHLATFLGWGSYGAPFARLGKGEARPAFKKLPLAMEARVLKAPGGHVETAFQQESPTQQPILFLRADCGRRRRPRGLLSACPRTERFCMSCMAGQRSCTSI